MSTSDDPHGTDRPRRGIGRRDPRPEWEADGSDVERSSESTTGRQLATRRASSARKLLREQRAWGLLPFWLVPPWGTEEPPSRRTDAEWSTDVAGRRRLRHLRRRETSISDLPVLTDGRARRGAPDPGDGTASGDEIRMLLYREVLGAWRQLTDVRFRLMAMLPALSIVAFIPLLLVADDGDRWAVLGGVVLALLGLCVTHGLHIYEQRNDGLYNDLISRARRIEAELGVETGLMLGRPAAPHDRISHGRATRWVFGAVKAAWLAVALMLALTAADLLGGGDDGRITAEEFDAITPGMTRQAVAEVVGGLGEVDAEAQLADGSTVTIRYGGDPGGEALIRFEDGVVVATSRAGLG